MNGALRDQDRVILQWLAQSADKRGDFISLNEIQETLDITTLDRVESSLKRLERDRYIRTHPDTPPGFTVLRDSDGHSVPLAQPDSIDGDGSPDRSIDEIAESQRRPNPAQLPKRQAEVYRLILDGRERSHLPTISQIMSATKLSKSRVYELLEILQRKGFILLPREADGPEKFRRRESRHIVVVGWKLLNPPPARIVSIRVLGHIAAGYPIQVRGHPDWTGIPQDMIGNSSPDEFYVLIVQGDSMIGDAVLSGDRIIVREQETARDGDMVVAQIQDQATGKLEATLKRYRHERGRPWLVAANTDYAPFDARTAKIEGKVIGLLRYLPT